MLITSNIPRCDHETTNLILLNELNTDSSKSDNKRYSMLSLRSTTLSIQSANSEIFNLDRVKGSGVKEMNNTAEELSDFCGIPLKRN